MEADVCFVIDASGSIRDNNPAGAVPGTSSDNWTLLLEFVIEIIGSFTLSDRHAHVGVVVFSNDAVLEIPLSDHDDGRALQDRIRRLNYVGGFTNTADALRVTREQCFSTSRGARTSASDLAIIITDGVPTLNTDRTALEANALKAANVEVIAVGITSNVDTNTLRLLSSAPQIRGQNYFETPQFTQLGDILDRIVEQACVTVPLTEFISGTYSRSDVAPT